MAGLFIGAEGFVVGTRPLQPARARLVPVALLLRIFFRAVIVTAAEVPLGARLRFAQSRA